MLFDPSLLLREPLRVLTVVAIIILGKSLVSFIIVLAFRYPVNTALTVSASLAQIGEFSFILAGLGVSLGVLPAEGQGLLLVGALISIALSPLVFASVEPAQRWIRARSAMARTLERSDDPLAELPMTFDQERLTGHVVVVGYGRVGRRIGEALLERGMPIVVADENREIIEQLRLRDIAAVCGDASQPAVLIQAHIARAQVLVVATPDVVPARKMIEIARTLKPGVTTIVRTHSDQAAELLRKDRADKVFIGEQELALGMTRHVLERLGAVHEHGASPVAVPRA